MKRFLILTLLFLSLFSLFAENQQVKKQELIICTSGGKQAYMEPILNQFYSEFPGYTVDFTGIDVSSGAAITISALVAAGTPPDVYIDYMARAATYLTPDYAVPFPEKVVKRFDPTVMSGIAKKGKVYGLPTTARLLSMFINLSLLKKIGYTIPENWTINDFLVMCEKAKQAGIQPYTFFAANQSSCEWLLGWFPAFGCEYFQNGDYTHTTIKSTGGVKYFEWILKLYKLGYIHPDSAVRSDDNGQADITEGKVLASGTYINSWDTTIQADIDAGRCKEMFEYTYIDYPRAPGIKKVPLFYVFTMNIPHKFYDSRLDNKNLKEIERSAIQAAMDEKNKAILRLAELFTDIYHQTYIAETCDQYPTLLECKARGNSKYWEVGKQLQAENGLYNFGSTLTCYNVIRASLYPVNQALLTGKMTPEQAITEYERKINEALNQ